MEVSLAGYFNQFDFRGSVIELWVVDTVRMLGLMFRMLSAKGDPTAL